LFEKRLDRSDLERDPRLCLRSLSRFSGHANPSVTATAYAGLTAESREQLGAKLAQAFGGPEREPDPR
jgi:hypothetical protein